MKSKPVTLIALVAIAAVVSAEYAMAFNYVVGRASAAVQPAAHVAHFEATVISFAEGAVHVLVRLAKS